MRTRDLIVGWPIFRLTVPANQTVTLPYQWEHVT
jgi:hypothetical protein